MRSILCIFLLLPVLAFGRDFIAEGSCCIASNSGAGSVDCLRHLYYESNLVIRRLEDEIVALARQKRRKNDIGQRHYELAVSAIRDASRRFQKLSERQCEAEVGYYGAVASGTGQVYYNCLLVLNEGRKTYLLGVLKAQ